VNGERHRTDGPAIEKVYGGKYWYQNGKRHRTDGPAIEYATGTRSWYVDGKLHRLDGPAVEDANGERKWFVNDRLHRLDGPACEYADGDVGWFINGNRLSKAKFNKIIGRFKPKLIDLKVNNAILTDLRTQRLTLGLTFRAFCKINNVNPVEQRQLERSEQPLLESASA
jgi:hypothetical protein